MIIVLKPQATREHAEELMGRSAALGRRRPRRPGRDPGMIVVLKPHATREHAEELMGRIAALGLRPLYMPGQERVVLGALGDERALESLHLDSDPLVESVKAILAPYQLVRREIHPH